MKVKSLTHRSAAVFSTYRRMAYRIAKNFSIKFGRPYQELVDEAEHALGEVVVARWELYDAAKAKPSTWLYQRVYWKLMDHCQAIADEKAHRVPLTRLSDEPQESRWSDRLRTLLSELGHEGRALVQVVLEAPPELVAALESQDPTNARRVLRRELVRAGWSPKTMRRAFRQVEVAL